MKKLLLLVLMILFFVPNAFADRNTATVTTYQTSQLVKRGDAKIYSITFVATANSGEFVIYDSLTETSGWTNIKAEGSEVTATGSQYQNFSDKPLELGTGLYLKITSGYVVLRYE